MFSNVGSRAGRGRLFRGNSKNALLPSLGVAGQIANQYGGFTLVHQAIEVTPIGKTKALYAPTGANQTLVVPDGVTHIYAKVWGAGGGSGSIGGWSWAGDGGGGGHSFGLIPVIPGETLYLVVGSAGLCHYQGGSTPGYGGGGGYSGGSDNQYAGSGGGYSGIFRTSVAQANALLIAGGGGGSSALNNGNYYGWINSNPAGAGGGVVGVAGKNTGTANYISGQTAAGSGGTQSAGGVGGTGSASGQDGAALTGGYGGYNGNAYGGGGGGGYFGGGGGTYSGAQLLMGPGGGGSGFVHPNVLFGGTYCGCGRIPAFFDDPDLPQVVDTLTKANLHGWGGQASYMAASTGNWGNGGGGGYIVIYY